MKKETIEEAAFKYAHNNFDMHENNNYKALKQGFEAGSDWKWESFYTEADMKEYAMFYYINRGKADLFEEWFKQFKK